MLHNYRVVLSIDIRPDEIFLHQTPMFHAASMVASVGGSAVLGGDARVDPVLRPEGRDRRHRGAQRDRRR